MTSKEQTIEEDETTPNLIIAGGGPSGLLGAILFSKLGIRTTVIERATAPDEWSTKSYTIVLSDRGKESLSRGGCLEAVKEAGLERRFVYIMDGKTGDQKKIPKQSPGIGVSRPLLAQCLEEVASKLPNVTIQRGSGISKVTKVNNGDSLSNQLEVHLEDGTVLSASHVIGSDGKFSKVRQSVPELDIQGTIQGLPSFGVGMIAPFIPEGWDTDGTYVIRPAQECMFYIIASPLPSGDEMSLSMVCYDETVERYPWLAPPEDMKVEKYGSGGWEDEYSAMPTSSSSSSKSDLVQNLATLFEDEIPAFYNAVKGIEAVKSARINRRVSWLQMVGSEENKNVTYSTNDGLVTLMGDAAHAMSPSTGEGCNTAMESAVKLADAIQKELDERGTVTCTKEVVSAAFLTYGSSRPLDVMPIQKMSASQSRMKKD